MGERLAGKTALITAAGQGIGRATALAMAREGAQVFCVDRNGKAAQETVDIITSEGGTAAEVVAALAVA